MSTSAAIGTPPWSEPHGGYAEDPGDSRIGPRRQTGTASGKRVAAAERTQSGPLAFLARDHYCVKTKQRRHGEPSLTPFGFLRGSGVPSRSARVLAPRITSR